MATVDRKEIRRRIHKRIRRKLAGSSARPRLAVYFSNLNVYAQVIDDDKGVTLCAASTIEKEQGPQKANVESATRIGKLVAERAKSQGISAVVFDRAGFTYHGKVKALADAAREAGLKF
jgi:large subunit ribosomal protein L18